MDYSRYRRTEVPGVGRRRKNLGTRSTHDTPRMQLLLVSLGPDPRPGPQPDSCSRGGRGHTLRGQALRAGCRQARGWRAAWDRAGGCDGPGDALRAAVSPGLLPRTGGAPRGESAWRPRCGQNTEPAAWDRRPRSRPHRTGGESSPARPQDLSRNPRSPSRNQRHPDSGPPGTRLPVVGAGGRGRVK